VIAVRSSHHLKEGEAVRKLLPRPDSREVTLANDAGTKAAGKRRELVRLQRSETQRAET